MSNESHSGKSKATSPFPEMEKEVLNFWGKGNIFKKSVEKKAPLGEYTFFDGPPFATGMPHYGHIVASVIKDAVPRYWTMKGYKVVREWGWDCHGLPVENLAEKELNFKSKTDIEQYTVDRFNNYCESIVLRYAYDWKGIINRIGRWVDMENGYKTMDAKYMESVWWVFKSLWDKGLIYQGYKPLQICPRCGTVLANFEVAQGYKEVTDITATVKFKVEDKQDTYILAWTTTPWTLIGNVALAIGKDIIYASAHEIDEDGNVAKKTIIASEKYFEDLIAKGRKIKIEDTFEGKKLEGLRYEKLFPYFSNIDYNENGWQVYAADFVTTDEGTGVVHIAPAFGEDDLNLKELKKLPFVQHVDKNGRIIAKVIDFAGAEVKPKDAPSEFDKKIISILKKRGALFASEKYAHSYPHCWRCDTPLLNYATDSWFVKVTAIKDKMVANNAQINWVPKSIKEGRFGKWIAQSRDWAISRNRYWGSPLPVWVCDSCKKTLVVGSQKELEKASGVKLSNLHKHVVDKISWKCSCGGTLKRVPEVLDCWFESGSMPYAQLHYPFENKDRFEKGFPANFIAEGIDQTRGWFYSLLVLSTALFNKPPFKNVIVNGIVLAANGQKMSKRLKNYPDPSEIFEKYSVDALRYYLLTSPVLMAEDLNFSEDGVRDGVRKVEMLLWNVYTFYAMYNSDEKPEIAEPNSSNILDKWILARLDELVREVTNGMDNYTIPKAIRPIEGFINDLSSWYIRRSRVRFKGEDKKDKEAALATTRYVLVTLAKVLAPFMPFIAEQIWQKVTGNNFADENKSVHLESWPEVAKKPSEENLKAIEAMEQTRKVVELVMVKRKKSGFKVRQPLSAVESNAPLDEDHAGLIKDEANIKHYVLSAGTGNYALKMGDISVKLNTELTPELLKEGAKRELVHFINGIRKEKKATRHDQITIGWESNSEIIKGVFADFAEELKKETGTKEIKNAIIDREKAIKTKINEEGITLEIKF